MDTYTPTNSFDVIIPYKAALPDEELLYSLMSLNNIPHRHVYVVGDVPSWYTGNHIRSDSKQWNQKLPIHNQEGKIRAACENPDVSDNFILSNDDFFVMKPTHLRPMNKGTLRDHLATRTLNDNYTKSIRQTIKILNDMGISNPLSYELHIPMVLNKQKRLELSYMMERKLKAGYTPLFRSLYGNLYLDDSEYMDDVKNIKNYKGSTYLSTTNMSFHSVHEGIGKYIRLMLS